MNRILHGGLTLLAALVLLTVLALPAGASDKMDYVLDTDGSTKVYIPLTYTAQDVYAPTGAGGLNDPQDFCLGAPGTDYEKHMFIADTGNNRILILAPDGRFVREITEADGKPLLHPSGITVDEDNDLYISDTGNYRILHMTLEGQYIESFVKPESDMLDDAVFDVTRIALSKGGLFYVMRGANFMMIDAQNRFQGLVGSTRVPYSLAFVFMRFFASQEQLEYYVSPEPPAYTSFTLGADGLLYATVEDTVDQIQIINGNGDNVYAKGFFGEKKINDDGSVLYPNFNDITVNKGGILSVLEKNSACIYQYDPQGNLLTVFGGRGDTKGFFTAPVALVSTDDNELYVLDASRGDITRFSPTTFIQNVIEAAQYYDNGLYDDAYDKWQEVYQTDAGYPLANEGIALALYKSGHLKDALDYYRLAESKGGYSDAYDDIRYAFFRQYFFGIVIAAAVLLVGAAFLIRWLYRLSGRYTREYFYGREGKKR